MTWQAGSLAIGHRWSSVNL